MMHIPYKYLLQVFVCIIFTHQLVAQSPQFVAESSGQRVAQNSVFQIRFELRNAEGDDFQPPSFRDFKIVGGPSFGSSTMIVNGSVSKSQSWSYSLLATTPGQFTIPSATVVAGRRKLTSNPVKINVLPAKDLAETNNALPDSETVKLIAHVEEGEYYPGQQIILEYKLLFSENVQAVNTLQEDDYAEFFIQNFNSFSKEASYQTIGDQTFVSRTVKAIALFPHQSGIYEIDPMVMDVGINAPHPTNQGFFTMRRLRSIQVASEPLKIKILPQPDDVAGLEFSGAVGEYSIKTMPPTTTTITTNEDFTLRVEISGNGDARRWAPPVIATSGAFEIYDPTIVEDHLMDADGGVLHSRVIDYVLLPKEPGTYQVYIPFRYFNPATKRYQTISSDTIELRVSQGSNVVQSRAVDSLGTNKTSLLKEVNNITTDDRFWLSVPHLFLFGLIAAGTCWGLVFSYKKRREDSIPASERMRSAALRNAREQLNNLSVNKNIDDKQFFEIATEIYYRFLSQKTGVLPADLDQHKLDSIFSQANLSPELHRQAIDFFELCLSIRYGGFYTAVNKDEMINNGRKILEELDSALSNHI